MELLPDEKPCASCGSEKRNINLLIAEKIQMHELLKTKQKRKIENKTKIIHEQKIGDELFKKDNAWRYIHRVFDHIKDKYSELIIDKASGKTIIDKNEKLSKHYNHGSAKFKKPLR
ncbi:hypothetical protein HYV12_03035 [Candidatus Dojkabacteria bacterium]|nr:hypothetical protein [Candidatus Dojkabacteria bacterium]